jgi:hypothetical protein
MLAKKLARFFEDMLDLFRVELRKIRLSSSNLEGSSIPHIELWGI